MYTFFDKKHDKTIELPTSNLVSHYKTLSSGATLPLPSALAELQEVEQLVGLRSPSRNTSLGAIITKPSDRSFFVGTAWEDRDYNNQHDEDLALFTETSKNYFEVERLSPSKIKKLFPLWNGYHHGDKSYLE